MLCVVSTSVFLPVLRRSWVVWATPVATQTASANASSRKVFISSSPRPTVEADLEVGPYREGLGVLDLRRPNQATAHNGLSRCRPAAAHCRRHCPRREPSGV